MQFVISNYTEGVRESNILLAILGWWSNECKQWEELWVSRDHCKPETERITVVLIIGAILVPFVCLTLVLLPLVGKWSITWLIVLCSHMLFVTVTMILSNAARIWRLWIVALIHLRLTVCHRTGLTAHRSCFCSFCIYFFIFWSRDVWTFNITSNLIVLPIVLCFPSFAIVVDTDSIPSSSG